MISCVCVLCGKNIIVGNYTQTFLPIFFIPAMLRGTVNCYHFIPLSGTFDLGHNVSTEKPVDFIFLHMFLLIRMKCDENEIQVEHPHTTFK